LKGDLEQAENWLNRTEFSGLDYSMLWWVEVPEITRCRILIARGTKKDLKSAARYLEEYRSFSESVYNTMRTIDILVLESLVYNKLGQEDEAMSKLKKAVQLSAPGGWIRPFAENVLNLRDLLSELKKQEVYPGFVDIIIEVADKSLTGKEQVTSVPEQVKNKVRNEKHTSLTASEQKVLECISQGLRNKEIAEKLFNSEETIKKHIYNMFQKLEVKNRMILVSKAKELGILK
jgi:LuxR family maltose regulon positive regulatory protein